MEGTTAYQNVLVYVILPILGIGLMIFALGWGKTLKGRPVEIALDKIGLNFKADATTLLILVGFILVGAGVYFWQQQYETRLSALRSELKDMRGKVSTIAEAMQKLKQYDLRLNLLFPEDEPANPFTAQVQPFVLKKGEHIPRPFDEQTRVDRGEGGIVVYFDKLGVGDRLYVFVEDGGLKWRSDDMVTPTAHLKMNRMDQ